MQKVSEKSTSIHTIIRLLLRELRREEGRHQAEVNQLLGRTTASWSKVEAGEADLNLDQLLTVCYVCNVQPWAVLQAARDYAELLNREGWYVAYHGVPLPKGDDMLSKEADAYYALLSKNPEVAYMHYQWRVLDAPRLDQRRDAILGVFRWIVDVHWRADVTAPRPPVPATPLIPPAVLERLTKMNEDE